MSTARPPEGARPPGGAAQPLGGEHTGQDHRPRIVHLALKVEDLDRTTAFYRDVFGFTEVTTTKVRDHTSRHLTDGSLDFALIQYDAGTSSAESRAAGDGPCIHHFAVEVDDVEAAKRQVLAYGCEIISDEGVVPIKFRAPGGTVAELVPRARYENARAGGALRDDA